MTPFPPHWIDAHCHLAHLDGASSDLRSTLQSAIDQGACGFIQAGIHQKDWDQQLDLKKQWPHLIHPVFGIHPWEICPSKEGELTRQLRLLPDYLSQAIAVGETGLDLGPRHHPDSFELQKKFFQIHLEWAAADRLPIVLHIVHAHEQALEQLRPWKGKIRGIIHSFGGSLQLAHRYIDLGLTISIGPAILRQKGFETLKRAMVNMPAHSWVIESDAPDREGRGPLLTLEVARTIARIRQQPLESVLEQALQQTRKVFERC